MLSPSDLNLIQSRIGYEFKNDNLLVAAFTHSSFVNEHSAVGNERIEFLGDCALNFLVGERLFLNDRTASEGKLSSRRAALVSRTPLAGIIDSLGLLEFLQVGAGVDKARFSDKARSDLFEAILGAVYLDAGLDACRIVLDNIFYKNVKPVSDYKSALLAFGVSVGEDVVYDTVPNGDGFMSVVKVGTRTFEGFGVSKHSSQIDAAKNALAVLRGGEN